MGREVSILQCCPLSYLIIIQGERNKKEGKQVGVEAGKGITFLNGPPTQFILILMGEEEHHQPHADHSAHAPAASHGSDPFTAHERVLIEMAHRTQKFQAHHHHHSHHQHVEYRRPFNLTTDLGCFALKKLNAMNPEILTEKDKKLLNPSGPGVITHLGHGLIITALPLYAFSVWKNFGFKAFARPVVALPLGVLVGTSYAFQNVANYCRELTFAVPRSKMVNHYKDVYGEKFLIDVLEPSFRLPESLESK